MKISIIVPFYNSETTLEKCAHSLIYQDFPDDEYEIIMVDNNSTDMSSDIVSRFPRIKLEFEEKQGSYAARNRGLKIARGDIIAFTDSDCAPRKYWLANIERTISQGVFLAIGRLFPPNDDKLLSMIMAYEYAKDTFVFNSNIEDLYYGHTNNMAVSREVFDTLGNFQERLRGGDSILVRKAVKHYGCDCVKYLETMCVEHMEVNTIRSYYKKVFIYGRSRESYKNQAQIRQLSFPEKIMIFRNSKQQSNDSFLESLCSLVLLSIGLVFWNIGKLSVAFISSSPTEQE